MTAKRTPKKSRTKLTSEDRERIASAALERPDLGIRRLSLMLAGEGIKVTEGNVHKFLKKQNLQTRELRLKLLEERHVNEGLVLSEPQQLALNDFNPCLRERFLECHKPGQLLIQDAVDLGKLKNIGRMFLHVAIDPSCCLTFAELSGSADAAAAVAVLNDQALVFFQKEGIAVQGVMAGQGLIAGIGADPQYENFLKNQGISLKLEPTDGGPLNGFVERFERSVRKEFLAEALRSRIFQDLEALKAGFDDWLERFNRESPLPGFPIMGRAPLEAFRASRPPTFVEERIECRPEPEAEPVPAPLPAAAAASPSPTKPRAHEHFEWKSGRKIWGFRAINAALVCLVIFFGWLTASKFIYYHQQGEDLGPEASVQSTPTPGPEEAQARLSPIKEYQVVWDRNLFGGSTPSHGAAKREKIDVDKIAVAGRDVGLKLIGTAVASDPQMNYAIIDVASTRDQGIFREKDRAGTAVIKAILRNNVIIETPDGRRKRLTIDEEAVKNPTPLQASLGPLPQPSIASSGLSGNLGDRSTFHVPREDMPSSPEGIRNAIEDLNLPDQEKVNGFPVGRVIARDILYQLGVRTGDVIKGLDDYEFTSPGDLEYFFQRLAKGGDFTILVERRGHVQKLNVLVE